MLWCAARLRRQLVSPGFHASHDCATTRCVKNTLRVAVTQEYLGEALADMVLPFIGSELQGARELK
jgi:hypothetical protein